MSNAEIFSQKRMDQCAAIAHRILATAFEPSGFQYTVRATESVHGLTLDQLRTKYFAVGVGEQTQDVPLLDVLVVFSLIEQQYAAIKAGQKQVKFQIATEYSDAEAARILSSIQIQTPFDNSPTLRIVAERRRPDDQSDS